VRELKLEDLVVFHYTIDRRELDETLRMVNQWPYLENMCRILSLAKSLERGWMTPKKLIELNKKAPL
jgi:hypothetical protein